MKELAYYPRSFSSKDCVSPDKLCYQGKNRDKEEKNIGSLHSEVIVKHPGCCLKKHSNESNLASLDYISYSE